MISRRMIRYLSEVSRVSRGTGQLDVLARPWPQGLQRSRCLLLSPLIRTQTWTLSQRQSRRRNLVLCRTLSTANSARAAKETPKVKPRPFNLVLVGRPNVGKSTLFNRLTRTRSAIVHDVPGTTRDRRLGKGQLADMNFNVVDTGGLEEGKDGSMELGIVSQVERALEEANIIFFVVDAREGVTPLDRHFARWLHRRKKEVDVHLLANKCEGNQVGDEALEELYRLGFGDPIPISAEHGQGLGDIADLLLPLAKEREEEVIRDGQGLDAPDTLDESILQLAICGRVNVGKSTLLNRILGEDRVLTGPTPGLTRDAIAVEWQYKDKQIRLVDTAGIRRVAKRDHSNAIEDLAVRDAERALAFAQVVAVVFEIDQPEFYKMDLSIAQKTLNEGRALILIANKADQAELPEQEVEKFRKQLGWSLAEAGKVPLLPVSALQGDRVDRIMPQVLRSYNAWNFRVSTGKLNRWLESILRHHPPPSIKGKAIKLKYLTQIKSRPPTFVLFSNREEDFPEAYLKFLSSQLREEFALHGVPVRLKVKTSDNPYKDKGKKVQKNQKKVEKLKSTSARERTKLAAKAKKAAKAR